MIIGLAGLANAAGLYNQPQPSALEEYMRRQQNSNYWPEKLGIYNPAAITNPIPNPEPNPVLLLLE